ncbi:MAG: CHRD domain-containing protein, partial [Rhodothermales bacterium]
MMIRSLFSLSLLLTLVGVAIPRSVLAQTAPVAQNDQASAELGALISIDVLDNDSDADGDPLTILDLPTRPTKGLAAIVGLAPNQRIEYRSDAGVSGTDTFTYRISDGKDGEATATVTITIVFNEPPVAVDDEASLFSHEVIDLDVLDNDDDPDGDSLLIVSLPMVPRNGTAIITNTNEGQRVRYDPREDFFGSDSLSYEIADLGGATDTATVRLDVSINNRPTAEADSASILINTPFDINVLANDTDPDNDPISILGISVPPMHGTAEIVNNQSRVRYTPDPGFVGTDQFEYTLTDSLVRGGSLIGDRATVSLDVLPPDARFETVLSGANVVPATASRGTGFITAALQNNDLSFSGTFSGLSSAAFSEFSVLVHRGMAGQNGEILLPLTATLSPDGRNGTILSQDNTFTLEPEAVEALFARALYINVLTNTSPGGEIRGQLLPSGTTALYRAVFSGRAEAPPNFSNALGGAIAERYDNILVVTGAFSMLDSDFNATVQGGAHIHKGNIGSNGDILFNLTTTLDADDRSGTFEVAHNQFTLDDEQLRLLDDSRTYLNIHTDGTPDGEIRGQFLPFTVRIFEAALSGRNEVPQVNTSGTGGILATFDAPTLTLTGSLRNLSSRVDLSLRNGAHIHLGSPIENNVILFELAPILLDGGQSGSFLGGNNQFALSIDQVDSLFNGQLYVNVHTLNHPPGEVRGQLLPSTNVAPNAASIISPADDETIIIAGDPSTPFSVSWHSTLDANGNPVYYRWQLARDLGFDIVIFESDTIAET